MRTSTRVRKALIGVVGAAALTVGALAATAVSASAATTAPASPTVSAEPWYGCYGYGCIGKDAQVQGCSKDAYTVYAISVYDGVFKTRVTLRLRYSAGCESEWATVTDTGRPDGAVFWIYDRGTHALEVSSTERATFVTQWQTTLMVGVAQTKAQACIEVRNPHGWHGLSAPVCTPFIGH
jgi:opacity protein-like surface antigen